MSIFILPQQVGLRIFASIKIFILWLCGGLENASTPEKIIRRNNLKGSLQSPGKLE